MRSMWALHSLSVFAYSTCQRFLSRSTQPYGSPQSRHNLFRHFQAGLLFVTAFLFEQIALIRVRWSSTNSGIQLSTSVSADLSLSYGSIFSSASLSATLKLRWSKRPLYLQRVYVVRTSRPNHSMKPTAPFRNNYMRMVSLGPAVL